MVPYRRSRTVAADRFDVRLAPARGRDSGLRASSPFPPREPGHLRDKMYQSALDWKDSLDQLHGGIVPLFGKSFCHFRRFP